MSNPSIEDYAIGWICALQEEYDAAARMLDAEFDGPDTAEVNDNNCYVYGRISGHNVVLGCLPGGQYGTNSAASVARDMVRSFPKLRFALMVGIGGGAPTAGKDIRLGDVVVSQPQGKLGGVVQYDLGKRLPDGRFEQSGQLNGPPQVVLGVLPEMRRRHNDSRKPDRIAEHVKLMDEVPGYQRPTDDRLYRAEYLHQGGEDCSKCEMCEVVQRPPRSSSRVVTVHYGTIASANSVMKNAKDRDEYARDPALNVLCFEMEAAGLMNSLPCLVIRGICYYSDSHKNDQWHNYAALAAAAYARELLCILKPNKVYGAPSWAGKIEELLAGIQGHVMNTSRGVNDLICQNRDQADEAILNWLTKIDHGSYHSDIANKRQPGTGQWILEAGKFQTWLKTSKQTLFCTGAPGAGKTILTSVVVEHLTTRSQSDRNIGVAYLYCNYNRRNEQQLNCLLECLLKQLAERRGSVPECVKSLYDRLRAEHMRPSVGQLSSALDAVVSLYSKVFIVIDALDECRDTDGSRAELLVEIVGALQKRYRANIFVTSRSKTNITKQFEQVNPWNISAREKDLRMFMDGHMSELRGFVHNDPEVQEQIKTAIIKAAKGVFLLAALNFDSLKGKYNLSKMQDALSKLPTGSDAYDRAYKNTMDRIMGQNDDDRDLAKQILSWVTFAKSRLTTTELQHALAVEAGKAKFDEKNITLIDTIISVCIGLVIVDKRSNIIRLRHYTLQDYFLRTRQVWFPNAEGDLAVRCVCYLSLRDFESRAYKYAEHRNRQQAKPLYRYAVSSWGHHAREASMRMDHSIIQFLQTEAKVSSISQALMASQDYFNSLDRGGKTCVHIATLFGLKEVVVDLLGNGDTPDPRDSFGKTPLLYAAAHGYNALVELLLTTYGVDPDPEATDPRDDQGRTPLSFAAEMGNEAVVKLLLARQDVNPNSKNTASSWTPLLYAAHNGHEDIIKQLLNKGANPNMQLTGPYSEEGQTPLSIAAKNGHDAIVELFLARPDIDINSRGESNWTPLCYAAQNGHTSIVRRLLNNGADPTILITTPYDRRRTPLSLAVKNGHGKIVELFLAHPDIDIKQNELGMLSPLHDAAEHGRTKIAKRLLDKGADPTVQEADWPYEQQTPLLVAAENRKDAIVELLLTLPGVDIEQKGSGNWTLLCYAVRNGNTVMVKRLLDKGADPNVQATPRHYRESHNKHCSPLSIATEKRYRAIVQLLLEAGANPNFKATGIRFNNLVEYSNQPPLSLAAEVGDEAVTALLLNQKRVQVNLKDDAGRTPFHFALVNGHTRVAKKLLLSGGSFTGEKLELDRYFNRQSPRMPAEHQDLVWILSLDNATIEVERDVAEKSLLIKSMLELIGDGSSSQERPIQLPYANGTILRKVFQWCEHHRSSEIRNIEMGEWNQNYMQVNRADVMEIVQAAVYLGIDRLWQLGCKIVASEMNGKFAEDICEYLDINRFLPEVKAEIRWRYIWPFRPPAGWARP